MLIGIGCKETSFKFVGIRLDEFLQFKEHINSVKSKLASATFALSKVKNILPEYTKLTIYNSLFKSHLDYCNIAWGKSNPKLIADLQTLQKKAIRYVANTKANAHVDPLFIKYKILKIKDMVDYNLGSFMYKFTYDRVPYSFKNFFERLQNHERNLNFRIYLLHSINLKSFPSYTLPCFWNSLSLVLKRSESLKSFKTQLKDYFHSFYSTRCTKHNCFSCK